ncbi:MAG: protein translocase subunit SecD [Acidobacteriaceae bacterium]
MGKNLATRTILIIAILLIFVYGIFGIPQGGLKQSILRRINLGLDLKGGIHLVLQVHVAEAINSQTDRDVQSLNTALASTGATAVKLNAAEAANTQAPGFDVVKANTITIQNVSPAQQSAVHDILTGNEYANYDVDAAAGGGYTLTMKHLAINDIETRTLDVSIETIRERIDKLGTLEPVIEKYGLGENEILLELPGVFDPAKVQKIIETTPKLEIHAVVPGGPFETQAAALQSLGGVVPPEEEIVEGDAGMGGGDQFWILKRAAVVEGTDFRDAQPSTDENGRPDITFTLTTEAGDRFYKYTDANKGTGQMAIVLDNRIREVAGIESAIRDQGRITGGFSQEQAESLSQALRSGSIPATISYLDTLVIGPSLGAQSIHQGVIAAVAGMLAVMAFMLIYYRGGGVNADLALFLNLVILLGFMGYTGSTLTLPGIAGVILTIGMGVDSNVLIFERIREELRLGKTAAAAVQDGFGHAWITIVDTHITTIVSAGILFLFGTGPVKGFAVTLTFGLLANIFTAVFVSRTIFDFLLTKKERGTAELSI